MRAERTKEFRMRVENLLDDYSDVIYKELADIIIDVIELAEKLNRCN